MACRAEARSQTGPGPPPRRLRRYGAASFAMACRAEAHASALARVSEGWWPRFSQMEPTDQLDAPNRRLPESRVKRFAKRKSASRTSSIFLVNPSRSSTSPTAASWLPLALKTLFWRVSGTIVGTVDAETVALSCGLSRHSQPNLRDAVDAVPPSITDAVIGDGSCAWRCEKGDTVRNS